MNSTSEGISQKLEQRLATISKANGYETDAGLKVFRGRRTLTEDDVPCIVIVEGPEVPSEQQGTKVRLGVRYMFEAHDVCDPVHPNDKGHALVRDLKRAVFAGERLRGTALDGLATGMLYRGKTIAAREDGESLIFASVAVEPQFTEDVSNP